MRQILLPKNVKTELRKTFGVPVMTINRALQFNSSTSPLERKLRAAAMERGGRIYDGTKEVPAGYVPDCESTLHLNENYMEFDFGGVVLLKVYTDSCSAVVCTLDGESQMVEGIETIGQLMELQRQCEAMAKTDHNN